MTLYLANVRAEGLGVTRLFVELPDTKSILYGTAPDKLKTLDRDADAIQSLMADSLLHRIEACAAAEFGAVMGVLRIEVVPPCDREFFCVPELEIEVRGPEYCRCHSVRSPHGECDVDIIAGRDGVSYVVIMGTSGRVARQPPSLLWYPTDDGEEDEQLIERAVAAWAAQAPAAQAMVVKPAPDLSIGNRDLCRDDMAEYLIVLNGALYRAACTDVYRGDGAEMVPSIEVLSETDDQNMYDQVYDAAFDAACDQFGREEAS